MREAKSARFEARLSLLGRRYALVDGPRTATPVWGGRRFRALRERQRHVPVPLLDDGARTWWAFEDRIFTEDDDLEPEDVVALVRDRDRRRRRRIDRAHAALAAEADLAPRRDPIPREVRQAVWHRDGGRCVACGETFDLQYDHVIPVALGGASTVDNLELLCAPCNQAKGASLG
nr:HNH endonuclease signature motif containing protein [Patulibacter sp. SYSU D01012]